MTSEKRVNALIEAIEYLTKYQIPGAIVECGVWKGGSMMAAALALQDTNRELYLYDTFEGMTDPTEVDKSFDGRTAIEQFSDVRCYAGLEEVRTNMLSTGYPEDKIHFVIGRVEEMLQVTVPDTIALLRLDTDWYESTKCELENLYPRLVKGGILIIDDYGHWQGCKKAVDEYFTIPIVLKQIDYTGRITTKQ